MPRPVSGVALVALCAALAIGRAGTAADQLPFDRGAAGAWQALQKLTTTASLMHTTAHPDDEHGGMLALMSRGRGVRTSLLTLNRGEAGDNALGPELFEALGLIRTEELRLAGGYYGLDAQYFTSVADYGFSKRLDEALDKWGRERVLRDMVRAIRLERPLVIVSRFQGNDRDGHGQHQAAGLLTREAYRAAADPAQFPEQLNEGLRPWQALKLYMGGARENENWSLRLDPGEYSPALGDSFQNVARYGLSLQRSQTSGRFVPQVGASPGYYVLLENVEKVPAREESFFDGIDTTLTGIYRTLKQPEPPDAAAMLGAVEREVEAARKAFTLTHPAAAAPALARGLRALRLAVEKLGTHEDIRHVLAIKEQQFADALGAVLGISLTAVAVPQGTKPPTGPFAAFAPAATMGSVVPGQGFDVLVSLAVPGRAAAIVNEVAIAERHPGSKRAHACPALDNAQEKAASGQAVSVISVSVICRVTADAKALPTRPHFSRPSIAQPFYAVGGRTELTRPLPPPPFIVKSTIEVDGTPFDVQRAVVRRESQLPHGYALRELAVVAPMAVSISPQHVMVPIASTGRAIELVVELTNNTMKPLSGTVSLSVPTGWNTGAGKLPFTDVPPQSSVRLPMRVSPSSLEPGRFTITARANVDGNTFDEGVESIEHRDLETRLLYRPSTVEVSAVDVKIPAGLSVGYVMGVGDGLPEAIRQLGVNVDLLEAAALATAPLDRFNAIVVGTRAYAVRNDLRTHNGRLLEYAKNGGNLIVLYNTPEFDPARQAPFPAALPGNAEEVSEEDAVVTILVPGHPVLNAPNRISQQDFDGWIEQRGSKFWSEWDPAYTPLLESHDRNQPPQRGGWLHARYGKGHYSYVAYAFHRQLPHGVPGAYRLMANLLSLGAGAAR